LQPPRWEDREAANRKAHVLKIAAYEAPTGVQTLSKSLGGIVAHGTSRESLPDRLREMI
jgi:hypothetical protein